MENRQLKRVRRVSRKTREARTACLAHTKACGRRPGLIVEQGQVGMGSEFSMHGLEGVVQVAKKPRGVQRLRGRLLATCSRMQHGATVASSAHTPVAVQGDDVKVLRMLRTGRRGEGGMCASRPAVVAWCQARHHSGLPQRLTCNSSRQLVEGVSGKYQAYMLQTCAVMAQSA